MPEGDSRTHRKQGAILLTIFAAPARSQKPRAGARRKLRFIRRSRNHAACNPSRNPSLSRTERLLKKPSPAHLRGDSQAPDSRGKCPESAPPAAAA